MRRSQCASAIRHIRLFVFDCFKRTFQLCCVCVLPAGVCDGGDSSPGGCAGASCYCVPARVCTDPLAQCDAFILDTVRLLNHVTHTAGKTLDEVDECALWCGLFACGRRQLTLAPQALGLC